MNASVHDPCSIPCLYCDQRFEDVVAAQDHMAFDHGREPLSFGGMPILTAGEREGEGER
jgi:hypothetical protein